MKNGFKAFAYYLIIPAFFYMIISMFIKNEIFANILAYIILLIFFIFLTKKEIKTHLLDFKKNYKIYISIILKWVLNGFILMITANFIIQKFVNVLPNNEISNRNLIINNPILSLIYLLLIAPSIEEYVFRFSFKDIKNYFIYMIITCSLFAALHILSASSSVELWYFIPYFLLSFGFSNIFFKTKNYFSSLIGHMIHNTLCVIIILLF